MERIRKASLEGDAYLLGQLGPIAAEMDRKAEEWESRLSPPSQGGGPMGNGAPPPSGDKPDGSDFTGKRISAVRIFGEVVPVGSYKDALLAVAEKLQAMHSDFDSIAVSVRGRYPYFSESKADLRIGEKLKNSKLFIETHNSAERQVRISVDLMKAFGHDPKNPSVLNFQVEPNRTRAKKGARGNGISLGRSSR
jgi:hypothetical protein